MKTSKETFLIDNLIDGKDIYFASKMILELLFLKSYETLLCQKLYFKIAITILNVILIMILNFFLHPNQKGYESLYKWY